MSDGRPPARLSTGRPMRRRRVIAKAGRLPRRPLATVTAGWPIDRPASVAAPLVGRSRGATMASNGAVPKTRAEFAEQVVELGEQRGIRRQVRLDERPRLVAVRA